MLIDVRTLPNQTVLDTDLCIIGAGAAGITLAREFMGRSFRVALLESGGLEWDDEIQSLCGGKSTGLPYYPLETSRARCLGGTTALWEGWCRPFDELDFQTRDWVPHSGWPFARAALMPHYERARTVCRLGPFAHTAADWATAEQPLLPLTGSPVFSDTLRREEPPTRFGETYRDELAAPTNVTTYLHASVTDLETTPNAQQVTRVRVQTLTGRTVWVVPRLIVLAGGGIDNARLLLLSNQVQRMGLGNAHDLVGRFFMEHVEMKTAFLLPSDPALRLGFYTTFPRQRQGWPVGIWGVLRLAEAALRRERLLNVTTVEMEPLTPQGVESAGQLLGALKQGQWKSFARHARHVFGDLDNVLAAAQAQWAGRPLQFYSLGLAVEQAPNRESRVLLGAERDRLNQPRADVRWQITDLERHTLRRTTALLAQAFGQAQLGRLKLRLPHDDQSSWRVYGQWHHMGTTRMHDDPTQGVVNAHGRVHGIANLYVAGSSVFPTVGIANPTLTIVALALRLADHLKEVLG